MPYITLVLTTYNSSRYIKTIKEILDINCSLIEVIVVDDCSKQKEKELLQEQCKNTGVTLIENTYNSGVSYSRNRGIEKALGNYVGFVDHDDKISKEV